MIQNFAKIYQMGAWGQRHQERDWVEGHRYRPLRSKWGRKPMYGTHEEPRAESQNRRSKPRCLLGAKTFVCESISPPRSTSYHIYIYMSAITWYVYTNIHFYCFEEKFQHLSSRKVLTSDLQCKHFPKVAWFWYDLHVPKLNTGLQIMLVLEGYQAQQARCAESIEP